MRSFANATALTISLLGWSSMAAADAPIGLCLNWLDGVPNGQTVESCTGPLQERYQSDISNVERMRLATKAEERGLDIFLVFDHEDGGEGEFPKIFGHVFLMSPIPNPVVVEGASLEQALEYLARLTTDNYSWYQNEIAVSYEFHGCWLEKVGRTTCSDALETEVRHGFDLAELDVRRTNLSQGRVSLERPDRRIYSIRTASFGTCNQERTEFTQRSEPRNSEQSQSFFLPDFLIVDERNDYAYQVQQTFIHIARICGAGGAGEEQFLFD